MAGGREGREEQAFHWPACLRAPEAAPQEFKCANHHSLMSPLAGGSGEEEGPTMQIDSIGRDERCCPDL